MSNPFIVKREEQNEYARSVFRDNLKGLDAVSKECLNTSQSHAYIFIICMRHCSS